MFGQTGCVSLGPKADNSALIIVLIIIAVVIVLGLCSAGAAFRNPTACFIEKSFGWFGYKGDHTTQLNGDLQEAIL